MTDLSSVGREAVAGFIRGATGEAGKFLFTKAKDQCKAFTEHYFLGKKMLPPPTLTATYQPISAVSGGNKRIHVELDLELGESMELGALQQAQASLIFPPTPPPVISQVFIHLLVSVILTTSLKMMMDRISSKGDKGKPEPESSEDGNEKK